jgi:hypothetical protein
MSKDQIQSFIANYLSKQAEEGPAHEAGETPSAEMLEHAMGVGGEEMPHGDGPGGVDVEQLLSQLSPEELQALIAELSQGAGAGGEDVAGLSQGIEAQLAQNPEAQVPGAPPEKMAALDLVKSAHYIEGFIKQAMDYGLNVHQAVGMYDNAITSTVDALKKEAAGKSNLSIGVQKARIAAKKGLRKVTKSDTYKNLRNSAASTAAGLQENFHENKGAYGLAGTAAGLGAGYLAGKSSDEEKKAAYFEGVFKQAMTYGFSEDEAFEVAKEAADKSFGQKAMQVARLATKKKGRAALGKKVNSAATDLKSRAAAKGNEIKNKAEGAWNKGVNKAYTNPGKTLAAAGGAVAAAGGAGYLAGKSSKEEKKAAFLEGVFKQAMAYGFSEAEAAQFAQQAEASL